MSFFFYAILAVAIGTLVERIQYKKLTDYDQRNNREYSVIPGLVVGLFWPIALPMYGVFLGTKKVLDKYLKV